MKHLSLLILTGFVGVVLHLDARLVSSPQDSKFKVYKPNKMESKKSEDDKKTVAAPSTLSKRGMSTLQQKESDRNTPVVNKKALKAEKAAEEKLDADMKSVVVGASGEQKTDDMQTRSVDADVKEEAPVVVVEKKPVPQEVVPASKTKIRFKTRQRMPGEPKKSKSSIRRKSDKPKPKPGGCTSCQTVRAKLLG